MKWYVWFVVSFGAETCVFLQLCMNSHVRSTNIWAGRQTPTGSIQTAADPSSPSESPAIWQVGNNKDVKFHGWHGCCFVLTRTSTPYRKNRVSSVCFVCFRRQGLDNACEWFAASECRERSLRSWWDDRNKPQLQRVCWAGDFYKPCEFKELRTWTARRMPWPAVVVFAAQVNAVTGSSEVCEQHVAYTCYKSRLLNSPGKLMSRWK